MAWKNEGSVHEQNPPGCGRLREVEPLKTTLYEVENSLKPPARTYWLRLGVQDGSCQEKNVSEVRATSGGRS